MKYTKLSLIVGLIFLSYSCSDDILNKTDPTRTDSSKFYSNSSEMNQAVSGAYGQLQGIINGQWLYNEMISDNTTLDFNPSDRGPAYREESFEFFTFNSATSNILGMYRQYYNAIYNINMTLSRLESSTAVADDAKNAYIGQVEFLRAYYYFELTQYFGDVILITKPLAAPSQAWDYARKPQAEVYAQIVADLTDAAAKLPVSYDVSNVGRVTKGAALSLLGKVYLTQKQYPEAVATLNQVLPLGYALAPSYADVFDPEKKNGVESIFEVQYQGGNDLGENSSFMYTFAPRQSNGAVTGWPQISTGGWNMPTNDIIAAYEAGDLRKAASVGLDYSRDGKVVPYIKKYDHAHTIAGRTDDNWTILRYADVLLMLAEAINEQSGPSTEAFNYLNQVRQRAGLPNLSGLSQAAFRDKVLKERRVELAFENWRWFDLKRTKTTAELVSFMNAYGLSEKADPTILRGGIPYGSTDYIFHDYNVLYPIPANEIQLNNKLTQNTGY